VRRLRRRKYPTRNFETCWATNMRLLASALLLLLVADFSLAGVHRLSTEQLQKSDLWKDTTAHVLLFPEEANIPADYLQALDGITVVIVQKPCKDGSKLCTLLSANPAVARGHGHVWGVQLSTEGVSIDEFTARALESLLGSSLTHIESYYQYTDTTASHPNHFVILTDNTHSQEYITFLKALISSFIKLPYPLVVTTAVETLPLSRRPVQLILSLLPSLPPFHLWFVGDHDWYECWDTANLPGDAQGVVKFFERTDYPDIIMYSGEDSVASIAGAKFHTAYLFDPSGSTNRYVDEFVKPLASRLYEFFNMVVVNRMSEEGKYLADQLGVTSPEKHAHITVVPPDMPPGQDADAMVQLYSNEIRDVYQVSEKLYDVAIGERNGTVKTLNDPIGLDVMAQGKQHILAGFCQKGSDDCLPQLQKMTKILGLFQRLTPNALNNVNMVMAYCSSKESVKKYMVTSFPALSLYNVTSQEWRALTSDTALEQFIMFVKTIAEAASDTKKEPNWPPVIDLPSPMEEDDHFGKIFSTLKRPEIPPQLYLSDKTFTSHITSHKKTLVAFYFSWCMRSAVFLFHFKAAVDHLDSTNEGCLALVNCDDNTDICTEQGITTYPFIRIYQGAVDSFTDYTGILDSTHLLEAIGQETHPRSGEEVLELRPDTLPGIIFGHMDMPLIVWCDSNLEGRRAEDFTSIAKSNKYPQFTFTWMDSSKHSKLLHKIVDDISFPALLALDFMKVCTLF